MANIPFLNNAYFAAKVGIGTDSPGAVLEVRASASTPFGALRLSTSSTKYWQFNTVYNSTDPDLFIAPNGGTATMTLQSTGNVGIGTASPNRSLHVIGQVAIDNSTSPTGGLLVSPDGNSNKVYSRTGNATSSAHPLDFISGSSTSMRIASAGHILVNKTSSTGDIFQVQGNNNVYASRLDGSATVGQSYGLRVRAGTNSTDISMLIENTGGTDLFIIKGTGDTGIGVTTPRAKLDVAGGIKVADDTDTAGANKVGTLRYRTSGNNSYVDMCMQTGATTYAWINVVQNNW